MDGMLSSSVAVSLLKKLKWSSLRYVCSSSGLSGRDPASEHYSGRCEWNACVRGVEAQAKTHNGRIQNEKRREKNKCFSLKCASTNASQVKKWGTD